MPMNDYRSIHTVAGLRWALVENFSFVKEVSIRDEPGVPGSVFIIIKKKWWRRVFSTKRTLAKEIMEFFQYNGTVGVFYKVQWS